MHNSFYPFPSINAISFLQICLLDIFNQNSVSTGYGQPSVDIFGDSFGLHLSNGSEKNLSLYLKSRSRIETLCNRISKSLHSMSNPSWVGQSEHRAIMEELTRELFQLQSDFSDSSSMIGNQ